MSSLALASDQNTSHSILTHAVSAWTPIPTGGHTGRSCGIAWYFIFNALAPNYIPMFVRRARSTDIVIHHAPLPLNDVAILLGLPSDVALIVYWHADIIGYPLLKRLVAPLIRRVLTRADRIVVSGQPMIDNSEFLKPMRKNAPFFLMAWIWIIADVGCRRALRADEIRRRRPRHLWRSAALSVTRATYTYPRNANHRRPRHYHW